MIGNIRNGEIRIGDIRIGNIMNGNIMIGNITNCAHCIAAGDIIGMRHIGTSSLGKR